MVFLCGLLLATAATGFALRLQIHIESPTRTDEEESSEMLGDAHKRINTVMQSEIDNIIKAEKLANITNDAFGNRETRAQSLKIEGFPYDFSGSVEWQSANFEDKWEMFRNAVPPSKFQANYDPELDKGPVCYPTLVGPKTSDKLAILLHGFLSCPGLWFRVVPQLLERGFRVMLPTLPGHGRAWRLPKRSGNSTSIVDLGEGPIANGSDIVVDLKTAEDDIDDIPTDARPYQIFANTLGQLAATFKKEHPRGIIAVAGHSLGGAVTARYGMDNPEVIDRVMLLNPMLGLNSGWVDTIAYLSPSWRFSKGSKCERERGRGSGGTCQFKLGHVRAMSQFAKSMLCDHWGIDQDCEFLDAFGYARKKLGKMKYFQVVTTQGETSVDNDRIDDFVKVVGQERATHSGQGESRYDKHYCQWPSDLGHSYLSNRETTSSSSKWWHPYVEGAVAKFLVDGENVEVVRTGHPNECLASSTDVSGKYLNVLPALSHMHYYKIGKPAGFRKYCRGNLCATAADVLYDGSVLKQSHTWKIMHSRHVQILLYGHFLLIVTRLHQNGNVRDIYRIRYNPGMGINRKEDRLSKSRCITLVVDDVETSIPLDAAIARVEVRHSTPRVLDFCGDGFVHVACSHLGCSGNQPLRTPVEVQQGSTASVTK